MLWFFFVVVFCFNVSLLPCLKNSFSLLCRSDQFQYLHVDKLVTGRKFLVNLRVDLPDENFSYEYVSAN